MFGREELRRGPAVAETSIEHGRSFDLGGVDSTASIKPEPHYITQRRLRERRAQRCLRSWKPVATDQPRSSLAVFARPKSRRANSVPRRTRWIERLADAHIGIPAIIVRFVLMCRPVILWLTAVAARDSGKGDPCVRCSWSRLFFHA